MKASATATALTTAFSRSGELSDLEKKTLAGLDGVDLERATAQLMLQKQQEANAFASNTNKKLNEIAMISINNLR